MRLFQLVGRFRRRSRSRGQSLVEFAMILPVMLVLLAAALDLGRVFFATVTLNNAAREGAFQASQTPESFADGQPCNTTTNLVVCRVQLEAKDSGIAIATADIDMDCSATGCPETSGSTVTVEVTGQFQLLTPLLSVIFGGQTIPMSAAATAQVEYLPDPTTATLPPGPVAVFSYTPTTGILPGAVVSFSGAASSGNPTDWQWDFGDGNTAVGSATATHTYATPGTYSVRLTVINLAGTDSETHTVTVESAATPAPTATSTATTGPTAAPTPAPTPFNCYPPNVIGQAPGTAAANLINAGFNVVSYADLTNGQKNKIQSMNPDFNQCLTPGATITLHYRPN